MRSASWRAPNVQRLPEDVRGAIARARHAQRARSPRSPPPAPSRCWPATSPPASSRCSTSATSGACSSATARRAPRRSRTTRTPSIAQRFGATAPLTRGLRHRRGARRRARTWRCRPPCSATSTARSPRPSIVPADISFEAFKDVYLEAYALGLKGCTTYRPNAVTGAVLSRSAAEPAEAATESQPSCADAAIADRDSRRPTRRCCPASRLPERQRRGRLHGQAAGARGRAGGFTYKLRWPGSDHAMYITINDIERDGHAGGGPSDGGGRSRSSSTPRTSSTTPGRSR